MEKIDVQVDVVGHETMKRELASRSKEYEAKIYALVGEELNINLSKQLGVILFEKMDLPAIKKLKTG